MADYGFPEMREEAARDRARKERSADGEWLMELAEDADGWRCNGVRMVPVEDVARLRVIAGKMR